MIDVENSIIIQRPPMDVFRLVSNLENEPLWHTDVMEARKTSPGPVAPGTTYEFVPRKPTMGLKKLAPRIAALDPERSIRFETPLGGMTIRRTYRVEPTDQGARVFHRIQMDPRGPMRILAFLMRRKIRTAWDGFLQNMKQAAETRRDP